MNAALAIAALATAVPAISTVTLASNAKRPIATQPRIIDGYIRSVDYPPAAIRRGAEGISRIRILIRTDGTATDCRVMASSGHVDLDRTACNIVTRRTRFSPAMDSGGAATDTYAILPVRWMLGD